jgi:trehalose-6-phosphatase
METLILIFSSLKLKKEKAFVGKEQKNYVCSQGVCVPKPQHVFKIGKTFSSTKSDLQVESSSGTSQVPTVVSGALEEIVDLNASFDNTLFVISTPSSKALKKSTLGRKPNIFFIVIFLLFESWKLLLL